MASINSRLDQIENLLSPKQAAIAWLEQAQKFESPDEYSSWLVEQPPGDYPNLALARKVEASIRGHYRSDDPGRIEHAVYRAQQKVLFHYVPLYLHVARSRVPLTADCVDGDAVVGMCSFRTSRNGEPNRPRSMRHVPVLLSQVCVAKCLVLKPRLNTSKKNTLTDIHCCGSRKPRNSIVTQR